MVSRFGGIGKIFLSESQINADLGITRRKERTREREQARKRGSGKTSLLAPAGRHVYRRAASPINKSPSGATGAHLQYRIGEVGNSAYQRAERGKRAGECVGVGSLNPLGWGYDYDRGGVGSSFSRNCWMRS